MIPGYPTSLPPGGHDDFLLDFIVSDTGTGAGATVTMTPATGYGDNYWALVCDGAVQQVVYLAEGQTLTKTVFYDATRTVHSVSAAPMGQWETADGIDVVVQEMYFTVDKGRMVQIDIDAVIETVEAYGDSGQFSAWSLAGLARYTTGRPYGGRMTEEQIDITLENSGGTYTVTLSLNGYNIAQGSRVGNGVVTLTAQNSSGVSGSVTLAFTAVIAEGDAYAVARWAKTYSVVIGLLSTTVYDTGLGNALTAILGPFAAGTYNWSNTAVSDTGVNGTAQTGTVTVPGRPEPPAALTYVSGNCGTAPATPATTISFTAATTPGATYRIYDSELNMPTDFDTVAATHIAGTGTLTQLLPVIAIGAGIRRVVVESVNGGIESGVRQLLMLEYDASGNIVLPRPNVPDFRQSATAPVTAGRTINIEYTYDATEQAGVATQLKLWIFAEGAPIVFGAADGTVTLSNPVRNIYKGTISALAPADGHFTFCVRASTAVGTLSENVTPKGPLYVANTVLAAPGTTTTVIA